MANTENIALANNIAVVKNYVEDPNNLYGVLRAGLLTAKLDTPNVNFVGASTMSYPVFPLDEAELPNYSKTTGYARLNATLVRRELTVSQDKGYQMAIDAVDLEDSHTTAIQYINSTVKNKEIKNIDAYRLTALKTAAGTSAAITTDALADYDTAAGTLINNEIPLEGSILYCTSTFYNTLKASDRIRRTIDASTGSIQSQVVNIDGVTEVIVVPATRMPASTAFILVQPLAVIAAIKRNKTSVKTDPEDFDGILINRRLVHDCFVLEDRKMGIYVGTSA